MNKDKEKRNFNDYKDFENNTLVNNNNLLDDGFDNTVIFADAVKELYNQKNRENTRMYHRYNHNMNPNFILDDYYSEREHVLFSPEILDEMINIEDRRKNLIQSRRDYLINFLSITDFFSQETYQLIQRLLSFISLLDKNEKKKLEIEFLLLAFLLEKNSAYSMILKEHNITFENLWSIISKSYQLKLTPKFEKKNEKDKKEQIFEIIFSFLEEKFKQFQELEELDNIKSIDNIFESLDFISEKIFILFKKALVYVKSHKSYSLLITPEILLLALLESEENFSFLPTEKEFLIYKLKRLYYSTQDLTIHMGYTYYNYLAKKSLASDYCIPNKNSQWKIYDLFYSGRAFLLTDLIIPMQFCFKNYLENEIIKLSKIRKERKYTI